MEKSELNNGTQLSRISVRSGILQSGREYSNNKAQNLKNGL